jgi:anthranilate synthase component 2
VRVFRNDEITVEASPAWPDRLVLARPLLAGRGRHLVPAIRHFAGKLPILGVCLGHQSIGAALGGRIVRATLMHGKTSVITTDRRGVAELPEPFTVIRYHSLVIERASLPAAWRSPPGPTTARSWACAHRAGGHRAPMEGAVPPRVHPVRARPRLLRNFLAMGRVKEAA